MQETLTYNLQGGGLRCLLLRAMSAQVLRRCHGSCPARPAGLCWGCETRHSCSRGGRGPGQRGMANRLLAAAQVAGLAGLEVAAEGPGIQEAQGPA